MASIAKMSPSASQCRYPMEIIGKIWKLINISKMSLSANRQQSLMKIIRQMWKFVNVVKMGLTANQRQYSNQRKDGKIR